MFGRQVILSFLFRTLSQIHRLLLLGDLSVSPLRDRSCLFHKLRFTRLELTVNLLLERGSFFTGRLVQVFDRDIYFELRHGNLGSLTSAWYSSFRRQSFGHFGYEWKRRTHGEVKLVLVASLIVYLR